MTFHELATVSRLKRIEDWDHTSHISSHVISCFIDKPIQPAELNPYRKTSPMLDDPAAEYERLVNAQRKRSSFENKMGTQETGTGES